MSSPGGRATSAAVSVTACSEPSQPAWARARSASAAVTASGRGPARVWVSAACAAASAACACARCAWASVSSSLTSAWPAFTAWPCSALMAAIGASTSAASVTLSASRKPDALNGSTTLGEGCRGCNGAGAPAWQAVNPSASNTSNASPVITTLICFSIANALSSIIVVLRHAAQKPSDHPEFIEGDRTVSERCVEGRSASF